jgi:hypothetical protein
VSRTILISIIGPLICFVAEAQYSLGLTFAYDQINSKHWEQVIKEFNSAHPERLNSQPAFKHGYLLGADFGYERPGKFTLGGLYRMSNIGSSSENFGAELRIRVASHSVGLFVSYYPLGKAGEKRFAPRFSLAGMADWVWMSAFEFDRENNLPALALTFQDQALGYSGSFSAGVDIRVDRNIFISPFAAGSFSTASTFPEMEKYLFGEPVESRVSQQTFHRLSAGIRIHMTGTKGEGRSRKS